MNFVEIELSKIQEDINNSSMNDLEKYKVLKELSKLINEEAKEYSYMDDIPILDKCTNIMYEDMYKYLCEYSKDICLHGAYFTIYYTNKGRNATLSFCSNFKLGEKKYNFYNLSSNVTNIRRYYVFNIIKEERSSVMIKEQYEKFLAIRENDKDYFLPYLHEVIKSLDLIKASGRS